MRWECYGKRPRASILAAIAESVDTEAEPIATEISPARAEQLLAAGAQLVDVRQDYEWEAGRIDDATHIPLEQLPGRATELSRDRPVVFQCRSGSRSAFATSAFREAGYDAYNLAGGLQAWVGEGKAIVPEGGEVAEPLLDGR